MTAPATDHTWRQSNDALFATTPAGRKSDAWNRRVQQIEWRCWGEEDDIAVTCREEYPKAAAQQAAKRLGLEEGFVHMAGSTRSGYYRYKYLVAGGKVLGRA